MKKSLLLLLIFTLVLSGCNNSPVLTGIDLQGTFDENDLLIEETTLPLNEENDIIIPQIKGLKDSEIQDKINSEMYNRATALVEKYSDINYANYYTQANFANVISISFSVGFEDEPYSESIYFNYSLVDGEKLNFEDLFMPEADILSIVRTSFYKELAFYGEYDHEKQLHSPDENEVYKIVKGFMAEDDKRFTFSSTGIYIYHKNNFAEIKMLDYAPDIAIYSKYMTGKSIFTGEYEGFKNAFTCSNTQYDIFDTIEYGYLENNLWYDFTIGQDYISQHEEGFDAEKVEKYTSLKQDVYQSFYSLINDYRTLAKDNPDTFYVVLFKPSFSLYISSEYEGGQWFNTFSNLASATNSIYIYSMPLEVYENSFKDLIRETYRYEYFAMRGGAYIPKEELPEGVQLETKEYSYLYNYITGEEYTSLKDIFFDDAKAMEVIEEVVRNWLSNQDDLPKDITSLIEEMSLSVEGTRIIAHFPSMEDFTVTIWLDNFDKSMLKIFD
ncbi:MAG: hypothetical protein IJ297_02770 [Clostridia bacterium]|nr:hypothetical protein [Clostridia bacterium]